LRYCLHVDVARIFDMVAYVLILLAGVSAIVLFLSERSGKR
jgi:hypothetical protein